MAADPRARGGGAVAVTGAAARARGAAASGPSGRRDLRDVWRPTHALMRCLVLVLAFTPLALLAQRPDLLVLVSPFAVVLAWSLLDRPGETPAHRFGLSASRAREGEQVLAIADVAPVPGLDVITGMLSPSPHVTAVLAERSTQVRDSDGLPIQRTAVAVDALEPDTGGAQGITHPDGWRRGLIGVRPVRWGPRPVGPLQLGAVTTWGAFRWGPVSLPAQTLRVQPQPAVFDTGAPAPHPRGLVGTHRSARPGDGSEFATLRPFQVGDRLRRIHWPRSSRGQGLYVTSSYADQDTHVALIVDAYYDLGVSGGINGEVSTLDRSVRAGAAVAEHFLSQGDRVSLTVLSARTPITVPTGTGTRHGLRILDCLGRIQPGVIEHTDDAPRLDRGVRYDSGTLVVMISPLVSPAALTRAAVLSARGTQVVVVDALVEALDGEGVPAAPGGAGDALARTAWRLRMLERDREIRTIGRQGVAVVPWLGPGSLDTVLRELARRGRRAAV